MSLVDIEGKPLASDPTMLDELLKQERQRAAIDEQLEEACVFTQGEILLIRGGYFEVKGHSGDRLYLRFKGLAKDVLKRE